MAMRVDSRKIVSTRAHFLSQFPVVNPPTLLHNIDSQTLSPKNIKASTRGQKSSKLNQFTPKSMLNPSTKTFYFNFCPTFFLFSSFLHLIACTRTILYVQNFKKIYIIPYLIKTTLGAIIRINTIARRQEQARYRNPLPRFSSPVCSFSPTLSFALVPRD